MSWLISLLIAGAMFSSENNLPNFQAVNSYTETKNELVVRADESERFEQTYPLNSNGRVSVSNTNGSVTIEGWDRNEVKLEYVKTAGTKERLADVEVKIDAQKDSLRIEAEYNYSWSRNGNSNWKKNNGKGAEVEFRLMVPRGALLNEIETVNGSVNISNTTNSAKVSAVNGEVKAINISGTADLSTVNGTVTADFERLENTNQIKLETVNGQAFLTLPSNADATVRAETTNGKISNDFGLPVNKGKYVGSSLYGRIGSGTVKISLESVNGELGLRRRQDGKNPNPVTNLLGSKSDDDEDFDQAMDRSVRDAMKQAAKVQAQIPEMNAQIQQQVQKSMADAQKEIAKANLDANINQAEIQKNIKNAMKAQKVAMRMNYGGLYRGVPSVERKSETFSVGETPSVTIEGVHYDLNVQSWDRSEVKYDYTRISRNSSADPSLISVGNNGNQIKIDVSETASDNTRLELNVFVPKHANLLINTDEVSDASRIRIENVSGEISILGGDDANIPVDVRGGEGKLNINSNSGTIRVIGFRGAVEATTDDGIMNLEGNFQSLKAEANDGTIILTLPENANALIESNRNEINAEGVSLVRQSGDENGSMWKIGNGGQNYSLKTSDDGKIFVRGANSIRTN